MGGYDLTPSAVRDACAAMGMSAEPARALEVEAASIAASSGLSSLALRCARLVFDPDLGSHESVSRWPEVGHSPGLPPLFDAVVLLAGYRRLEAEHRRRGIPPEVTKATLRDLELWMEQYRTVHGRWGFSETSWLARHMTGLVYQLGRLQFEPHPLELPFAVFRPRAEGSPAILVEGGRLLRADGQFADADGATALPGAWRSRFVDDDFGWHGAPVGDTGAIQHETRGSVPGRLGSRRPPRRPRARDPHPRIRCVQRSPDARGLRRIAAAGRSLFSTDTSPRSGPGC